MKIIIEYVRQPSPIRSMDWVCKVDGWEPGDAEGYGRSPREAFDAWEDMKEELRPDPLEGIDVYGGKGQWDEFSRA